MLQLRDFFTDPNNLLNFFVLLSIIYYLAYMLNQRNFWKLAASFPGPPTIPLLGNAHLFRGTKMDIFNNGIKILFAYGNTIRLWIGPKLFVVVGKPKDLQIVMNSSKCIGKPHLYSFFKSLTGIGLFTSPVEKWKKHRRILNPAFSAPRLGGFFPIFRETSEKLVERLKAHADAGKTFDAWNIIYSSHFENICKTSMNYNLDKYEEGVEFCEATTKAHDIITNRAYKLWLHPEICFKIYAFYTGFYDACRIARNFVDKIIDERRKEICKEKISGHSKENENGELITIFDPFLQYKEAGGNFSEADIRDEVLTMLIGGSDTSALVTCFALLMFGMYPKIQEKAYDEICQVFGSSDKDFTKEDAPKMQYLEQCIKETMRLFPPGPVIMRNAAEDVEITGTSIVISPYKTHRDPIIYSNPEEFNPENFSQEAVKNRHPYSFIPFSGGPRGCIGSKYAMLSLKVMLSTILKNFVITTDITMGDLKFTLDLLLRNVDGYPIKLYARK